jgi:O-antigen/teichoic acid export membrane protein
MNYIFIASKNESQLLYVNAGVTLVNIIGNILVIPYYSFL